jgi:hypothetical protein
MMRTRRLGIALALSLAGAVTLATACAGKKQTEIVVGVETQMRVPADIQTVRLNVNAGGPVVFDQVYPVYNGVVLLPQTLALVPGAQQTSVTITALGYKLAADDPYFDSEPPASDPQTQILRRSVVSYASSRIVYLPMALRYACYQVSCSDSQTCVAGQCVDANVDSSRLPDYSDDLVFGNTSTCFSVSTCFAAEEPAVVVDPVKCVFTVPGSADAPMGDDAGAFPLPAAPGSGLNVRVTYENLETEVLDLDPVEGFSVTDPTKPQTFTLPQGLCKDYVYASDPTMTAPHKIVSIGVTALCPSKAIDQPLCTSDTQDNGQLPDAAPGPSFLELERATTVLYMLVDDSADMGNYFGRMAFQQVMSVTLSDPVFRSVDLALTFFPRATGCMQFSAADVPFQDAVSAQPKVATALMTHGTVTSNLDADNALGEAYAAVTAEKMNDPSVGQRAVVLITGNLPEVGNCAPTNNGGLKGSDTIATYVVAVNGTMGTSQPPQASDVSMITGAMGGGEYLDATSQSKAPGAFNQLVTDLTGCTYVAAPGLDPNGALSYVDPIMQSSVEVPPLPSGASCSTTAGWTTTGTLVTLCADACTALKNAIAARSLLAAFEKVTPPDLPVFVQALPQD